ncbi:UNVERIFIED_CONTAM: hypothetical protein FKN15_033097 [Acipenser sinensis]
MANYLLNAQIITRFECDVIKSKPVKLEKASELLSTIIRKGQRACLIFYQTLETCDPFLCERITGKTARTVHPVPVMTQTSSSNQNKLKSEQAQSTLITLNCSLHFNNILLPDSGVQPGFNQNNGSAIVTTEYSYGSVINYI